MYPVRRCARNGYLPTGAERPLELLTDDKSPDRVQVRWSAARATFRSWIDASVPVTEIDRARCPICAGATHVLDAVDFNKSCEEARGTFLPPSGEQIQYVLCPECGFSFAPQLYRWSLDEFEQRIYNDDYVAIDPDYVETRPLANAKTLQGMFDGRALKLRHLDYGGGNGLLSDLMRDGGWRSDRTTVHGPSWICRALANST